ncbi:MAG: thermonuclease family protein [Spirochaetes bacterium]|nr:thermonuclease family protein [Spirochaetota bacterium]
MKRYIVFVFIIMFICPFVLQAGGQNARVLYVIDGDTLKIIYDGKKQSIRLIGIDAPESKKNKKAFKDSRRSAEDINAIVSQGRVAKKYVKGLVKKGDRIKIQFDVEKRDKYRRLLGYVYLPDGRMLNDVIIRNGYASPLTIPPNVKYRKRFLGSYQYARKHRLGLWK